MRFRYAARAALGLALTLLPAFALAQSTAGGGLYTYTRSPTVGATTGTGQVPGGATATCKRNGTVTGSASVSPQGAVTCTFGSAIVAGDTFSIPWTLTGETATATASNGQAVPGSLGPTTASYATDAKPGTTVAALTGLQSGETVSAVAPTDGKVIANAAGNALITGINSSSAGTSNLTITTSTGRTLTLAATANAPATAAPSTPSPAATPLGSSFVLDLTDAQGSQPARRYGIYKSTTQGGAKTFLAWAYLKTNNRVGQSADTTAYYTVTAENAVGESAQSAEFSVATVSTILNRLRLGTTLFFSGVTFYTTVAGMQTGSTVAVTASDGSTLQVKTVNGAFVVYGSFPANGTKTLAFVETTSGGATNTSTQDVTVVTKPVSDPALFTATANAIKPFSDNPATYADDPNLTMTDMGNTMPSGYTGVTSIQYQGNSTRYGTQFAAVGSNSIPNLFAGNVYDHLSRIARPQASPSTGAVNNTVMRVRVFKQTIVFGSRPDSNIVASFKAKYSDDGMQSWKEAVDPFFLQRGSDHFVKLDPGTVPPASGRIWEIETSAYAAPFDPTLGVEPGDTPQAITDTSPVMMNYVDSFAFGEGSIDITKNGLRQAARTLGLRGAWNLGINSNRITLPFGLSGTYGLERIGGNGVGFGDADLPPRVDVVDVAHTINDNGQSDAAMFQASWVNFLLKVRYARPAALITVSVGFWSPQDRIPTANYNALVAAFNAVKDAGMILNDGIAAGWATASGATGSSPYWFASNFPTFTGSVTGNTLTVESISGATVESGKYLYNGTTYLGVRVYKQLTGTTGGAGTYRLTAAPFGGDIASGTTLGLNSENYQTSYPVHPNPAGQAWMGQRRGAGAKTLVNSLATTGGTTPSIPANAILDSSGNPVLDSSGGYILAQ